MRTFEDMIFTMKAMTPPMGWNTWNTFGLDISEELICSLADTMEKDGYLAAGYEYLVIDDGWAEKERDADGKLQADRKKFPRGIKAVADSYRSTPDIFDNFRSFTEIFLSQLPHFSLSASHCFNDLDMLTVGMNGSGNAAIGKSCSEEEYRMQFAMWCLASSPLFIGADIRSVSAETKALLLNKALIAINQDAECRPPLLLSRRFVVVPVENTADAVRPLREEKDKLFVFIKHLSDSAFALAFFNLFEADEEMTAMFEEAGLPESAPFGFRMKDAFTGEECGLHREYFRTVVKAHECRLFICSIEATK